MTIKNSPCLFEGIVNYGGEYLVKNAIGYIRVSTEEQGSDDKYGIDAQKQAIQAYASANGYDVSDWCIDKISGVKDNRPEFDKILYNPPSGIDAVIVFKNDRVARDTKLYFYYFYTLEKKNIKLLSTEENFREGDDFANIYRSLLMFVAEQERKNIALRTGKGRSLKVNPEEAPIVKTIFDEHDKGTPMLGIAELLDSQGYHTRKGRRFQVSTIKSVISHRPFYEGKYKYGDMDWVQGVHQPLLQRC